MISRRVRIVFALLSLVFVMGACRMSVDVVTTMRAGGDGTFRITFQFDKEFITLVQTSPNGRASLAQIRNVGGAFAGSGWHVTTTEPAGGLTIQIERAFSSPEDLQRSLDAVAAKSSGPLSFLSIFRDFKIEQDTGFFSSAARVGGSVDLTPEHLAPEAAAGADLKETLRQAAQQVFRFTVTAHMPRDVGTYDGDPARLDGSTIAWNAPFGRVTKFAAEAGGIKPSALALIGLPIAAAFAGLALLIIRGRRRRVAPVAGWEVAKPEEPATEDVT